MNVIIFIISATILFLLGFGEVEGIIGAVVSSVIVIAIKDTFLQAKAEKNRKEEAAKKEAENARKEAEKASRYEKSAAAKAAALSSKKPDPKRSKKGYPRKSSARLISGSQENPTSAPKAEEAPEKHESATQTDPQ